ncbi:MAG: hypothetical protein ACI89W_000061 [Gammaproteobacteria bacterium]|jgi:hypothetical protein
MIKQTRVLLLLIASMNAKATDRFTIFTKQEFNCTDNISSVGVSSIISTHQSNLKSEVITSINSVTVIDQFGYEQAYYGVDLGLRFGYFSKLFVYFEGGFDVFEATFHHDDDAPYFDYDDRYNSNNVDGYAALGAGVQAGNLRIEGFVKARQIDSDYWEANRSLFSGLQISLTF